MPTDADVLRRDIVAVCQRLYQRGFIAGTEGNVSALEGPDRLWITPSGHHKGLLQPSDLLLIDLQGQVLFGNWAALERNADAPGAVSLPTRYSRCRACPPAAGDSSHGCWLPPRTAVAP